MHRTIAVEPHSRATLPTIAAAPGMPRRKPPTSGPLIAPRRPASFKASIDFSGNAPSRSTAGAAGAMVSLHICSRIASYGWAFVVICPRFAAGYLRSKGKFTPSAHDGTVGNPRLEPAEPRWIHRRWFVSVTLMQSIIPTRFAVIVRYRAAALVSDQTDLTYISSIGAVHQSENRRSILPVAKFP